VEGANDIKTDIMETGCECVMWVEVAHDGAKWQAFVMAVTNVWFSQ
jgi:hypothetical protein